MRENTQNEKPVDEILKTVLDNMKKDVDEHMVSMRYISGFVTGEIIKGGMEKHTAMNIGYLLYDMITVTTAAACKD